MALKNQLVKNDPNQRVELDLNSHVFQKSWFSLEPKYRSHREKKFEKRCATRV